MLRLVQLAHKSHGRRVAVGEEPHLRLLRGHLSIYDLAQSAIQAEESLCTCAERYSSADRIDYDEVYQARADWRLLSPIDHPESSRCFVTGTGLTHKGSAENRQSM